MQKDSIKSISLKIIKISVCLCITTEQTVIFFVNGTEIYKFKAKDSEIVATPLCVGNISKDCR